MLGDVGTFERFGHNHSDEVFCKCGNAYGKAVKKLKKDKIFKLSFIVLHFHKNASVLQNI